jgi:hypothetical protein
MIAMTAHREAQPIYAILKQGIIIRCLYAMAPTAGTCARISCYLQGFPMAINQVKAVADIPPEELDDWGPVGLPDFQKSLKSLGKNIDD